jgi:hypothetical protein
MPSGNPAFNLSVAHISAETVSTRCAISRILVPPFFKKIALNGEREKKVFYHKNIFPNFWPESTSAESFEFFS